MPQTLLPQLKIRIKAGNANYSAHAGGTIVGRLKRGNDGKFTSDDSGDASATSVTPEQAAASVAAQVSGGGGGGKGKGGKGGGKGKGGAAKKPKLTQEQMNKNLGDIASKHLGSDLAEALTVGDTPGDISGIKPEYGDQLVKKGLAVKHSDGSYELSGSGKSYVKAAQSGDEKKAAQVLKHAGAVTGDKTARQQAQASARQQREQQAQQRRQLADQQRQERQNSRKKEFEGLRIRLKAGPSYAKRSEMPRNKFVFWENGRGVFPVEDRSAVMRAVRSWGRYKGPHSFADFKRNLTRIANSNGWGSALPAEWTDKKKAEKAANPKVAQVMGEFKRGGLHSGSAKGPKVRDRKQAIAIALSQAGLSKKTKEAGGHTGAMLAFMLPIEAANQLAQSVPDCDPNGMHLTLCYLGDIAELPYRLEDAVMAIAEYVTCQPPIFGSISGTGLFSSTEFDGGSVFYASFDAPALPEFRQGLIECLSRCGLSYDATHGYTPHITLSYLEAGTPAPDVQLPPLKLRFDLLTLAWGDQHIQIPLGEMPADPFDYYASKDVAGGMAGYSKETESLANAKNADFDRLFLAAMISHHQAAVNMANLIPNHTNRPELIKLGQSIIKAQSAEIEQMKKWQKDWGLVTAAKDVAGGMAGYGHGPGGAFTPGSLGGSSSGGSGHSSSAVMNAAQMPKTGDMVSWQTSGGKGRGKIVSLHKASTVRKTPVKTVGTEDEPAARIEIYQPDEKTGEWQPTGNHIAQPVSNLTKLVFGNSATKEAGKLSVYKDASGAWRWLTFSSSGYLDRDGEIVPTDELAQDCARADRDGDYGPLLWWHEKSLELGKCDLNAMCGRILVESGTFNDPEVGEAFSEIEEALGTSIGFGYQTKAEGVYKGIRKFERSLLPDVVASNTLTRVFINGDTNNMATIQKDKKGILERILGKDKVAQIESHATEAEKQAQLAGLAYKAAKPPGPTLPPKPKAAPAAAAPGDEEPEDEEDMLDGGADEGAEDEEGMDEEMPEGEEGEDEEGEEGEFEGSPADNTLDMKMESLHNMIDSIMLQRLSASLAPLEELLQSQTETATKEVNGLAVTYKEVTTILITALKENTEALKTLMGANQDANKRIVQLEQKVARMTGELPRAANKAVTRASASPATIVGKEAVKENLDPDTQAMNRLAEKLAGGAFS